MGCFGHLYNLHLELLFHHHRSMLLSDCYQSSYCVRFFSDFSDCWHVEKFELSLFFFLTSLVICLPFVLLCERQCILCTYIIKSKRSLILCSSTLFRSKFEVRETFHATFNFYSTTLQQEMLTFLLAGVFSA